MAAGDVDAVSIWEPIASKVEAALSHPVILQDEVIYRLTWNLIGLRDSRIPVEKLLWAIRRANTRLRSDDPRVIDELARWCDLDRAEVLRLIPYHHFSLQLEGSLLMEIEEQARLLDSPQAVMPDMLPLLDPAPLMRVKPEAINIPVADAR
jgi:ABC-type nitrate/sulfonate/bicarbonate transport system substrate-binding protein